MGRRRGAVIPGSALRFLRAANDPCRVEPAIGLSVIGKSRDVPVAEEGSIGGPDRWAATNEDDTAGKPREHLGGRHTRANLDERAAAIGKVRNGGLGARPHHDDVAARELPETLDVRTIFRASLTFPRQPAAQTELAVLTNSAHRTDVGHRDNPRAKQHRLNPWHRG